MMTLAQHFDIFHILFRIAVLFGEGVNLHHGYGTLVQALLALSTERECECRLSNVVHCFASDNHFRARSHIYQSQHQ